MICNYGCGREAIKQFKNGKGCCSKFTNSCPEVRRKLREKKIGTKQNEEHKKKNSNSHIGQIPWNKNKKTGPQTEEHKRKQQITSIKWWNNHPEVKEERSLFMKTIGGAYANSFNKNPSKPEKNLRSVVSQVAPYVIFNYPIYRGKGKRSYSVDIVVSKLGIIIEYDGWYHSNSEERKERDKQRQQEIEEDGWKFIRYNIFQKFPSKKQVLNDIQKIVAEE